MAPTTKLALVRVVLRATKDAKPGSEDALVRERALWVLRGLGKTEQQILSEPLVLAPMGKAE